MEEKQLRQELLLENLSDEFTNRIFKIAIDKERGAFRCVIENRKAHLIFCIDNL